MDEPLNNADAKKLACKIALTGDIAFSKHARDEMTADNISETDCTRVIRGGFCEGCDFENGSWRYRFYALSTYVVIAFRSENELVVVTTWRKKE